MDRRGFIPPILVAVLALVIAVGGVGIGLAWKTNRLDKWLPPKIVEMFGRGAKPEEQPGEKPEEKPETKPEEDKTKGWKTYRNEKYGYEIKYPKTWVYGSTQEAPAQTASQIVFTDNKEDLPTTPMAVVLATFPIVISVGELTRGSTEIPSDLLYCSYEIGHECGRKPITIGGMQGEQLDDLALLQDPQSNRRFLTSIVFQNETASHPPRVWHFTLQRKATEYREIYDLMLSTFKFL